MNETTCDKANSVMTEEDYKKAQELRDKPFAELTTDQKIDRLVDSVRGLRYTTQRVSELENKINKLYNHLHADGKVVTDIKSNEFGGALCGTGTLMKDPLN